MDITRRTLLRRLIASAGASVPLGKAVGSAEASSPPVAGLTDHSNVRDRLWVWGHVEGSHNNQYGLPGSSRMTPAEGAFYLNVPNIIMVGYPDVRGKEPCQWLPMPGSFEPYAISFRPLKRVAWFFR